MLYYNIVLSCVTSDTNHEIAELYNIVIILFLKIIWRNNFKKEKITDMNTNTQ